MATVLFGAVMFNLAEVTRMIEIAKALDTHHTPVFFGYEDDYVHLITDAGFEYRALTPAWTPAQRRQALRFDQAKSLRHPFTMELVAARVSAERALIRETGAEAVVISAAIEAEVAQLAPAEQKDFLDSLGLTEPGLDRVIRAGYALLGLITYFTAGPKEARAWTIHRGTKAPGAAGAIHTDFERGFIRAQTIAFDDYVRYGGETGAKEVGRARDEGKEYCVADGDVMLFKFHV